MSLRTRLIAATAAVLLVAAVPARSWAGWKEGKAAFDAGLYEEALAEFRAGAEASLQTSALSKTSPSILRSPNPETLLP
jgi:hypothetical protein